MKKKELVIGQIQLSRLLSEEQKQFFNHVLTENIFCSECGGVCQGITITEIRLCVNNDVVINGVCKGCNNNVGRLIEFGEDQRFWNKAMALRTAVEGKIPT